MIIIMFFGSMEGIISSNKISERSKTDNFYRFFSNKTTPDGRTIRDYKLIYKEIYRLIISF